MLSLRLIGVLKVKPGPDCERPVPLRLGLVLNGDFARSSCSLLSFFFISSLLSPLLSSSPLVV